MTTPGLEDLLPLARAMTASLSAEDRTRRLVELVHRALPADAVALLRLEGDALVPAAARGLSADVFGRRFPRAAHPRLDIICASRAPTRFPADSPLPDPYDGLVIDESVRLGGHVHSCLGCPLTVEGELVGVLTADALVPGAFDGLDDVFLEHLAALAGASLRTNDLIEALQRRADQQGVVVQDLVRDALQRRESSLVGQSEAMARLRHEIGLVGASGFPVLVTGETGTGKELVVRTLHARSPRADQALVYVNCAALPESVVESELFGHARGAFTGADRERLGKFRVADGASLFLDEIGELPLPVQPKLLRALQDGEIQSVGADHPIHVDVRVFAATNRDLEAEVRAGRFRSDLLHRLDVCRIAVPPLRDRAGDVPVLAGHFADVARVRLGTGPVRFAPEAQDRLVGGDWPGNVRELENVIARGVLRAAARVEPGAPVIVEAGDLDVRGPSGGAGIDGAAAGGVSVPIGGAHGGPGDADRRVAGRDGPRGTAGHTVASSDVPRAAPGEPPLASLPLRDAVREYQRRRVRETVRAHGGNWAAAARALGMGRANLHHLAKRLGLKG